ncbi:MAG TPA: hypothetical protein PLP62_00165 [Flavobacteriaceae bacterium]|nr:hypothetical protein [Flavobacteriaceae bacterium]HRW45164.1 hypothetical protein [Flavobacteriaceae bacterium]
MREKKKTVTMAVVGLIIGMAMSIIFNKSSNVIALIPLTGALGGLIGAFIDKRRNKKTSN